MTDSREIDLRRILVAMDASPCGTAALEAAATLAAEASAELQGLFVEDINLLRLAGLPFAREVSPASGSVRSLDPTSMQEALQREAENVRGALAAVAEQTSIRWSFQITRGSVTHSTLEAASDAELLLIGRKGAAAASEPTERGPVLAVVDADQDHRVLDAAARLARDGGDSIVALVTDTGNLTEGLESEAPLYIQQCGSDLPAIVNAVVHWRARLLLLHRGSPLVAGQLSQLIESLPCPLVVVG